MTDTKTDFEQALRAKFRTRIAPFVRRHVENLSAADAEALLKQFTPDNRELHEFPGFSDDPLHEEDLDIHPFPDVIHKYPSKILYLTTDECPVYCRYCTRKRATLLSDGHTTTPLDRILAYLKAHPRVNEVIFSGGDPMMLPTAELLFRAEQFLSQPTIHYLRFHTRAATTAPALFSEKFLIGLSEIHRRYSGKLIAFVLHINTAAEISDPTRSIVRSLHNLGVRCYAQSVLLRGVNDNPHTLAELCVALANALIQPYYLHQLDRVTGSAHFEVSDERARALYAELKELIPAYLLPKLVRDSKQGKFPL